MKNIYIEGRMNDFQDFFCDQNKKSQQDIIRGYYRGPTLKGRDYCEFLGKFLIQKGEFKIGASTFENLVDEIEDFILERKRIIYSQQTRDIIACLLKKSREADRL